MMLKPLDVLYYQRVISETVCPVIAFGCPPDDQDNHPDYWQEQQQLPPSGTAFVMQASCADREGGNKRGKAEQAIDRANVRYSRKAKEKTVKKDRHETGEHQEEGKPPEFTSARTAGEGEVFGETGFDGFSHIHNGNNPIIFEVQ
jgi:hypothetical protein